jgi:pentapeptide MXKDX repeat protein
MRKLFVCSLALASMMSMAAMAQDTMKQDDSMKQDTMKSDTMKADKSDGKLKTVSGKVSDDDKTITDKSGKSWTVKNPEALKGHEGHDVVLKAHVYNSTNEVHVMSVKMAKSGMKDDMKKDSMQH